MYFFRELRWLETSSLRIKETSKAGERADPFTMSSAALSTFSYGLGSETKRPNPEDEDDMAEGFRELSVLPAKEQQLS